MKSFASDNFSGIHPNVVESLLEANRDHAPAYGDDPFTKKAESLFKKNFGKEAQVFFVFNGTAANVLGLKAVTHSYHSIICANTAHLNNDECGAPESFTGCKLQLVNTETGKLAVDDVQEAIAGIGDQHHVQARVISITQSTELGTVYTPEEIRELASFAKQRNLLLHMDGSRLANAAASLGVKLREITRDSGVDVLSFGGTKNGLMGAEAIIFFDPKLAANFKYLRKQGMQLASKMRFLSAQFIALFTDDLWLQNAHHANNMARYLSESVRQIKGVELCRKVEANGVFVRIPKHWIDRLQKLYFFYVWDASKNEVRWMTSFDTTKEDVDAFCACLREVSLS